MSERRVIIAGASALAISLAAGVGWFMSNATPTETQTVQGTVTRVHLDTGRRNSSDQLEFMLKIKGNLDTTRAYVATSDVSREVSFTKEDDLVLVTYVSNGSPTKKVIAFENVEIDLNT